jgi:hypothetical protein
MFTLQFPKLYSNANYYHEPNKQSIGAEHGQHFIFPKNYYVRTPTKRIVAATSLNLNVGIG